MGEGNRALIQSTQAQECKEARLGGTHTVYLQNSKARLSVKEELARLLPGKLGVVVVGGVGA